METTEAEAYVEAMLSFTNAKRALSGAVSSAKALTRNQMVEAMADVLPPQSAGAESIERYAECMGGLAEIICEMRSYPERVKNEMRSYPERVKKELEAACKRAETAEERLSEFCDSTIEKLRDERKKSEKQVEAFRSIRSQPVERTTSINPERFVCRVCGTAMGRVDIDGTGSWGYRPRFCPGCGAKVNG